MKVNLNREDLISLVKASGVNYSAWGNELVEKAGHSYSDAYGRTYWGNLHKLTEEELYQLYIICKDSW